MVADLLLCLFVVVDVLGFSLVLPLLPYLATESYNATPTQVGLLMSSNAIAQLVAAPFIGHLSDRYGRRPLLLYCICGTIVSFALLAMATLGYTIGGMSSLNLLFVSRVLDGLLGGNTALAQAYMSDITTKETRAKGMGKIGAAFGIGFVFGPAIGGLLCSYDHSYPAILATVLSVLNLLGVYFYLPESLSKKHNPKNLVDHSPFHVVVSAIKRPSLLPLLVIRFAYHLCFTMFETTFSMHSKQSFGLGPHSSSYLLAFVGIVFSMAQGRIGKLSGRFADGRLITFGFLVFAISMVTWMTMSIPTPHSYYDTALLLTILTPLSLSAGVLNTMINTAISRAALKEELGETLGLASSVSCLSRVVGPLVAGVAVAHGGYSMVGLLSCALCSVMTMYANSKLSLSVAGASCKVE